MLLIWQALIEDEAPIVEVPTAHGDATNCWALSPAYSALMTRWASRLPSIAHHDTAAWDDLICARTRMLHALKLATERAVGETRAGQIALETDERKQLLAAFQTRADQTMLALYEAAAAATREQGNFDASKAYLERTRTLRTALGEGVHAPKVLLAVFRLMLERSKARESGGGEKPYAGELQTVHTSIERMLPKMSGSMGPGEACEVRRLRAHVAWELGGTLGRSAADGDSAHVLVDKAHAYLAQNAADGAALGPARHASMRLELADLCDKAMLRLTGGDADGVAGADNDGGGGGGGGLAASAKLDELGSVAFEQVLAHSRRPAIANRIPALALVTVPTRPTAPQRRALRSHRWCVRWLMARSAPATACHRRSPSAGSAPIAGRTPQRCSSCRPAG
jgi:hypothetical protein